MSDTKMQLWNAVEATHPSATKAAKVDGQNITSISGQHMIKRATEMFGPVGIGWGWTVVEERFDLGPEVLNDKGVSLGTIKNHTVRIKLWFEQDGKRGEFEQYGCTKAVYKSSYGLSVDPEAPKKSLTDAIKKGLSMLGFSADIFLGMFDDSEYVQLRREEEQLAKAEDKEAEAERQKEERLAYLKSVVESMATAKNEHELKKMHDTAVRKLSTRRDEAGVKRIAKELATQTERLKGEAA